MDAMARKFLQWTERVALLVFPVGAMMIVFSEELATLWLQDSTIAREIALPISILAAGSMLNAVNTLPYAVQLAAGWSSLGFYANLIALFLMVPAVYILTNTFGAVGAATVWLTLNCGYVFVQVPIMFRRLLGSYRRQWYLHSVLVPATASFFVMLVLSMITDSQAVPEIRLIICLAIALGGAIGLCWFLKPNRGTHG